MKVSTFDAKNKETKGLCPLIRKLVSGLCNESILVKSVSKLYLQVDLICQNRHLVSYRQVPGSIPGRGSIDFFFFLTVRVSRTVLKV